MPRKRPSFLALAGALKKATTYSFAHKPPSQTTAQPQDINDRLREMRHEAGEGGRFNGGAYAPTNGITK